MQRFIEKNEIKQEIIQNCNHYSESLKELKEQYKFLDYKNEDFIKMILLFEEIVHKDYDKESLIISIGESPSKMIDIQTKLKIWEKKKCQCFYLPISKTILHIDNLKEFYNGLEKFNASTWTSFFDPIINSNYNQKHVLSYKSFLNNRGILEEFVNLLSTHKNIIFVDFIVYGNSFMAFFIYLFLPLIKNLCVNLDNHSFHSVFLVDSHNHHHKICDGLSILLNTYFTNTTEIFIKDYFSSQNQKIIGEFFMDNPIRTIQEVKAPFYRFPSKLPKKKEYMLLLLLIYMNIYLNEGLYTRFDF